MGRRSIFRTVLYFVTIQISFIGLYFTYMLFFYSSVPRILQTVSNTTDTLHRHELKHSSYGHCQSIVDNDHDLVNRNNHLYFQKEFNITSKPLATWIRDSQALCEGRLTIYGDIFGLAKDIIVNPTKIIGYGNIAKGGELVPGIPMQPINKEVYNLINGFFEIQCENKEAAEKVAEKSVFEMLKRIQFNNAKGNMTGHHVVDKFTIAIERGDYANLWNHVFEVYGVFLLMMAFKKQPNEVQIMFFDGHPSCNLDRDWETLFGPSLRVGHHNKPIFFKHLILGLKENAIPLSKWENPNCSYVEEFRNFYLTQYGLPSTSKDVVCDRLTFTVMFRRNQVYHPRNMQGNVERKIFNELDIIELLMATFPGSCIQALLMESIPMQAQLEIISETDVLIGMHGAGFMHSTFLPRHAGLVELFPYKYRDKRPHTIMYEKMSKWRGLKYVNWISDNPKSLMDQHTTIVNASEIVDRVKSVVKMICQKTS